MLGELAHGKRRWQGMIYPEIGHFCHKILGNVSIQTVTFLIKVAQMFLKDDMLYYINSSAGLQQKCNTGHVSWDTAICYTEAYRSTLSDKSFVSCSEQIIDYTIKSFIFSSWCLLEQIKWSTLNPVNGVCQPLYVFPEWLFQSEAKREYR